MGIKDIFSKKQTKTENKVSETDNLIAELVDSYEYGNGQAIKIVKVGEDFYIENYEGMGIKKGPYAEAIKTGDNGEILVRDIGADFYYVPGIDVEKPFGIGFIKEYHPEYHYAEPYKYNKSQLSAVVKMVNGKYRLKQSHGYLSSEEYNYYYQDENNAFSVYENKDGKPFVSVGHFLTLPLEYIVRPDSNVIDYNGADVPSYQYAIAFSRYLNGTASLNDLPYQAFLNDEFVGSVLNVEKLRVNRLVSSQVESAKDEVGKAASEADLTKIGEIDIDLNSLQEKLDEISSIVIDKRRLAVSEQEKLAAIDKKESMATRKTDKALDLDSIIRKSSAKPRKKNVETTENASERVSE